MTVFVEIAKPQAMQFDFFALEEDLWSVLRFAFELPGMRFLDDYSPPDQPNQWFDSWDDLEGVMASG